MHHLFIDKFDSLLSILNKFFGENQTRNKKPLQKEIYEKDVFELACQIYKRGFIENNEVLQSQPRLEILSSRNLNLALCSHNTSTFFLIDTNFYHAHRSHFSFLTQQSHFFYTPSEDSKNIYTVKKIMENIPNSIEQIFVLGGGITLDIGGFIAGLLRLPVHYLSTTLLACVDAGIGGKTGVNFFPYGKNQVGLFYNASSYYFLPEFMSTLKKQDILCGVVEAAKHSYLFGTFEKDKIILERIIAGTAKEHDYIYIVQKNFQYKLRVVTRDPMEINGIRTSLNFGHTLAHIIEALIQEGYLEYLPHGIAVAHGIRFLNRFQLIQPHTEFNYFLDRILLEYPLTIKKEINIDLIISLLSQDKKNTQFQKCNLSVPHYGVFAKNLLSEEDNKIPIQITKEFSIKNMSEWMLNYLRT